LTDDQSDSFMDDEELLVMLRGFHRLEQVGISVLDGGAGARASLIEYCKERGIDLYRDDT